MHTRVSARSEKIKCKEFELRSYPLRLDCPFRLNTPMNGRYLRFINQNTNEVLMWCSLYGCTLSPDPILELVGYCFLSDSRIKQVLFPYSLPPIDATASAVVYVELVA